jgi:hypothetical protein
VAHSSATERNLKVSVDKGTHSDMLVDSAISVRSLFLCFWSHASPPPDMMPLDLRGLRDDTVIVDETIVIREYDSDVCDCDATM